MKYSDVINVLKENNVLKEHDEANLTFEDLSYDSKKVKENTLFICKGVSFKKEYLESAIEKGVTCYVSEIDYEVDIPKIIVKDSRIALAVLSSLFYPDNLFKIAITGTKGKPTTNYFIHNILKHHLVYKPGIFATHYFYTGKEEGENHLTTPESLELHKYLKEMQDEGIEYMSMEASSQSVFHKRIYGMNFDIGAFLNIIEDHISPLEHKDFEDYFSCKLNFLKQCNTVIVYKDTDHFDKVMETVSDKKVITYGKEDADYIISDIRNDSGLTFDLTYKGEKETYKINMAGRFNVFNAACAIIMAKLIGVDYKNILKGLLETEVSGRMNVFYGKCPIIVDYAHNRLSAEALYKSLKDDYPGKKIKVVFGCPGDKGVNRRKDMGDLANIYADYIYLTAEDPGESTVETISKDIIKYIDTPKYEIIEDRKEAILKAINEATEGDVLALLGKGDENYQIVGGKWLPYETDIVIVKENIKKEVNI